MAVFASRFDAGAAVEVASEITYWASLESYCEDAPAPDQDTLLAVKADPKSKGDRAWAKVYAPMVESGELSPDAAVVMRSAIARRERIPGLLWRGIIAVMFDEELRLPSEFAFRILKYPRELDYLRSLQWSRRLMPGKAVTPAAQQPDEPEAAFGPIYLAGQLVVSSEYRTRQWWRQMARLCAGITPQDRLNSPYATPGLYLSYIACLALRFLGLSNGQIARALPTDRSSVALDYHAIGATRTRRGRPQPIPTEFPTMARGHVGRELAATINSLASLGVTSDAA